MAGELIDFGKFAQTAIAFQNMQANEERNALTSERMALERDRLTEMQTARRQQWVTNQINLGTKLVDDPTVSLPDKARVYSFIAGVAGFPDLNPEQLLSAGDTLRDIGNAVKTGDLATRDQKVMELGYRFPKLALDQLNLIEKTQGLSEKALEHKQKLEIGQARLQDLEEKSSAMKSAHQVYAPMSVEMRGQIQMFGTPGVRLFKNEFTDPVAINAFLNANPDTKRIVDNATDSRVMTRMVMDEDEKNLAYWKAQQDAIDRGESTRNPAVVSERVVAYEKALRARQAQYDFYSELSDLKAGRGKALDTGKYEAFVQAQRDVEESAKITQKGLSRLSDERLAFMEQRADTKDLNDKAQKFGNLEFQRGLAEGMDANAAAIQAAERTQAKFRVLPDTMKFEDPTKKGKLGVEITTPTTAVRTDLQKDVLALEPLLETTSKLREVVEQHPESVGVTGNIIRFMGGMGQQFQAAALSSFQRNDKIAPEAKLKLMKKLSTKAEDDLEAYSIGLTYEMARVLSGTGVLSDKDIEQAERLVSPLRSMRGADQFLNHLAVIENKAYSSARASSKVLQSGKVPVVRDAPTPATATDWLKSKGIDVPMEGN